MRIIFILIWKELLQIVRNRSMIPFILVMPVIQLIVLSHAATNEVKHITLTICDNDHSAYSRLLQSKYTASGYFKLAMYTSDEKSAEQTLATDQAEAVLFIPAGFERDLLKRQPVQLQILVNAINGVKGGLAGAYSGAVVQAFRREIIVDAGLINLSAKSRNQVGAIQVEYSHWYNPRLDYKTFMVPGILGELVTIIVMILTAMNIVREKEIGTIEQLNVTPIRKYQFMLGKLLPFLLIGLFDLTIGLLVGRFIFHVPMEGSLLVVFAFCVVNLIAVLGVGLLISTFAETQQQAMFIAWFFMMIFILMSGLFTPIESMPMWAQYITYPNPIAHFVDVMRKVLLKGSGFADIRFHFFAMVALGSALLSIAILAYKKTS